MTDRKKIRVDDDLHEPLAELGKQDGRTKTGYANKVLRVHVTEAYGTGKIKVRVVSPGDNADAGKQPGDGTK